MSNTAKTVLLSTLLTITSGTVWANERIKIWVFADVGNAAAVGYKVDGYEQGGLGKNYYGNGPKDMEYFFGYREDSAFGRDVHCGSLILDTNSKVTLLKEEEHCIAIAEKM